ncbi:hypothetical protein [Pseudidiomarina insulisalsae]|uniref:Uncharacterized protein n=1 Tax=Pseudidiomarina insulisalsae TaxID=575789 RepID=A0A432YH52_9GAMM|nr:hypothetical protein [Pseudidiomarina insulisalsae]RUO60268.1 hypothetical protein CWI71_07610 [Pseudidiomarina insulisalsae]
MMTSALNLTKAERALFYLRDWPLNERDKELLASAAGQQDVTVILTEAALEKVLRQPDVLASFSYPAYVLVTELKLYGEAVEELPAYVMQLNDASWVELTLESQPVLYLGDPDV